MQGAYDRDWVLSELRRSLTWLGASFDQQLQILPPGTCPACELAGDARHFTQVFLGNEEDLSQGVRDGLTSLLTLIDALDDSDEWQCWNESLLQTGTWWARLRDQAGLLLPQLPV